MNTKKALENKFVELPRGFPKIPRGYVPLGFGGTFEKPRAGAIFGVYSPSVNKSWSRQTRITGDDTDFFYLAPSTSNIANLNYPWLAATDPEPVKWIEHNYGEMIIATNCADESDEFTGSQTLDTQSDETEACPKCAYMWHNTWVTALPTRHPQKAGDLETCDGKTYLIRARYESPEHKAWCKRQEAKVKTPIDDKDAGYLNWLQDRKNWDRVMLESEFSSGNLRKAINNARARWQRD